MKYKLILRQFRQFDTNLRDKIFAIYLKALYTMYHSATKYLQLRFQDFSRSVISGELRKSKLGK